MRRICAAVDISEMGQKVGSFAISLARSLNSEVHAIYVIDSQKFSKSHPYIRQRGEEMLKRLEEDARIQEVILHGEIREGRPNDEIARFVQEREADLLVIGARSESPIKEFFLGGTALKIVNSVSVPVIIVK